MAGSLASRVVAVTALVLGAAVLAATLLGGGEGSYTISARFTDAGQLVRGDLVEAGGRRVGLITELRITDDGLAEVELSIDDDLVTPLHEGTVAAIRTVGLASVTNRVIELSPGPEEAPEIPDGGVLAPTHTRGVVDLDMLLNAIDPGVREDLRAVVAESARVVTGDAPGQFNDALAYLHPALSQARALGAEIVRDEPALRTLVRDGAAATSALASREEDLGAGLRAAAGALRQVADRRGALGEAIEQAPATLRRTDAVLGRLGRTLPAADAVLRGLLPAVAPLERILRATPRVAADAVPAIAEIRALLPEATALLRGIPALERAATPAMRSLSVGLKDLLPIVTGLRPYAPDFVAGQFNGFGGNSGGYYDANGHFIRISPNGTSSSFPGLLPTADFSVPSNGYRTGLVARCPGAAEEPNSDGSNPWVPDPTLCDPAHGMAP